MFVGTRVRVVDAVSEIVEDTLPVRAFTPPGVLEGHCDAERDCVEHTVTDAVRLCDIDRDALTVPVAHSVTDGVLGKTEGDVEELGE